MPPNRFDPASRYAAKFDAVGFLAWLLETWFPPKAPADREAAIRASTDQVQLRDWLVLAVEANSLDAFRQAGGL